MSVTNPGPPPQIPGPQPNQVPDVGAEYDHLLSYFKYLVTLTGIFLGLMVAAASFLFYSNLRAVREDAREEATRAATKEAQTRVAQAFEEKNINAMILKAAQEKVGTITDKLIEQQVTAKLQPIQSRISLIGRISESEMRMRLGFRAGLDELNTLLRNTNDPDVVRFVKTTLATTSQDFETRLQESIKQPPQPGMKAMQLLQVYLMNQRRPQESIPSNLQGVVRLIYQDSDLNAVAAAFAAFRDFTAENVKMFDFDAVRTWCSRNQPKCQGP